MSKSSHFLIVNICITLIILSQSMVLPLMWVADKDSVIIEDIRLQDLLKPRVGRISSWPWSSFIGRARSADDSSHLACYTTIGEVGKCSTLKSCYPALYRKSGDTGKSEEESNETETDNGLENAELVDTLKSVSGPCDLPYFNKFRLSSDIADALICCPSRMFSLSSRKKPSSTPSTLRPTTGGSSTTTKLASKVPDAVAALVYKPPPSCGLLNNSLPGTEEHENERRFPWIVALIGKQGHFCSGALIDKYHVITAAQCVNHLNSDDVANLRIFLGDYKLNTISDGPLIARRVSRIIYHRHFNEQTLRNDMSLLKLSLPAPIGTPKVLPICLPEVQHSRHDLDSSSSSEVQLDENETVVLAGWGRNWMHSPTPILRKTIMKLWSNEECRKKYGYLARNGGITESMLCASATPSQKSSSIDDDTPFRKIGVNSDASAVTPIAAPVTAFNEQVQDCIGDSGSPLMRLNKDTGLYELIGITSWNIGCGRYPYVYTRLSKYLSWIDKNRRRY